MKNAGILAAIGVVAILILVLFQGERPLEPAPDFSLLNLNGDVVVLSSFRGSVVILDFWASWCRPCKETFPAVHALHERYADRGVVLLVVSLDSSVEEIRRWMKENGYPSGEVLWGSLPEARAVKGLYGVVGIPHTFLIDREGYIRFDGHPRNLMAENMEELL
ncbi:MAG TPA: TlpA family protein disulfide reductase [Candidatus Acetothermia bacterium]|nr:TlpA family protein disulfide reductase [Candidatus Acetothermia bacterium]